MILLTGFEPFGGEQRNPSIELARNLEGCRVGGMTVVARELPCEFGRAGDLLIAAVDQLSPRLVLAIGLAGGRSGLSFERVAINLIDARIADNAGAQPIDEPICAAAPAAYFSTLPLKRMVAAARRAGVEAAVSHSAGTFVCNEVFYRLQRHLAERAEPVPGGFLHVPWLVGQPAECPADNGSAPPAMTLAAMADGLLAALAEATHAGGAVPGEAAPSEGSLH